MPPKVSIVTSTYNRAPLLAEAIRSVQAQTYTDWEMIVVDDGSQDNTREIVAAFTDTRIRYIYKQNAGLAAGRNTGIETARGEFIAFLDDDDLYMPHHLKSCLAHAEQHPEADWLSSGYQLINEKGQLLAENHPWQHMPTLDTPNWLMGCSTAPSTVMVKREWLDRVNGFDAQHGLYEDWDLWLRLSFAGCVMQWVRAISVIYRLHSTNMTHSSPSKRWELSQFWGFDKFFARPDVPPELQSLRGPAYATLQLWAASAHFNVGDYQSALDSVRRALDLDPTLSENQGQRALQTLFAYASGPRVTDPMRYTARLIDHLPQPPFALKEQQDRILGRVASDVFFNAAARADWKTARYAFMQIALHDRTLLRNRGIWSIMAKATLGPKLVHALHGRVSALRAKGMSR